MIPNGKEMNWNGHHLVFESEINPCAGCFFADKDECPDCDEGLWVEASTDLQVSSSSEIPNNWHTGTPTEEGEYICWTIFPKDICRDYEGSWKCKWKNGKWFDAQIGNNLSMDSISAEIIAWQKIEPYKEKEDGHTD